MAGFAGLRRSELVREYAEDQVLRWEDINWQKQLITVRHEVAKQTSRKMGNRRFIPMEAALLHWLGPYRKEEGLLIPMVDSAVRRRMKKLRLASKVNPPTNALRHSYASYWLARSSKEGLGELSKRMGNSEAVCKRHYLETLTREEGAAWFKIRRFKSGAEGSPRHLYRPPKICDSGLPASGRVSQVDRSAEFRERVQADLYRSGTQ